MKVPAPVVAAGLLVAGSLLSPAPAGAQAARLEGSWSGGGRVVLPSGATERARCRATFRQQANSYGMSAVCATPSARIAQSGSLQRVGPGLYSGRFYNAEYDVSGSVRITVRGSSLTANLAGGGGRAQFTLSR